MIGIIPAPGREAHSVAASAKATCAK
jgi:hypothetical protein